MASATRSDIQIQLPGWSPALAHGPATGGNQPQQNRGSDDRSARGLSSKRAATPGSGDKRKVAEQKSVSSDRYRGRSVLKLK